MKLRKRLTVSINGMVLGIIIVLGVFLQVILGRALFDRAEATMKSQTADAKKVIDFKIQTFTKTAQAYATNAIYTEALAVNDDMTKGMVQNALEQIVQDSKLTVITVALVGPSGDLRVVTAQDTLSQKISEIYPKIESDLQASKSSMHYTFKDNDKKIIVMAVPVLEYGLYSGALFFSIDLTIFFDEVRDTNSASENIVTDSNGLILEYMDKGIVLDKNIDFLNMKKKVIF